MAVRSAKREPLFGYDYQWMFAHFFGHLFNCRHNRIPYIIIERFSDLFRFIWFFHSIVCLIWYVCAEIVRAQPKHKPKSVQTLANCVVFVRPYFCHNQSQELKTRSLVLSSASKSKSKILIILYILYIAYISFICLAYALYALYVL